MVDILYIASGVLTLFFIILLLGKPGKQLADYILIGWFGLFLVNISAIYAIHHELDSFFALLIREFTDALAILHGPIVWFYTRAVIEEHFRFRWRDAWHLLPFGVLLVAVFYPVSQGGMISEMGRSWMMVAKFVAGFAYILATLRLYQRYRRSIVEVFSFTEKIQLNWLRLILWGALLILTVGVVSQSLQGLGVVSIPQFGGFFTNLLVCIFIIVIGYFGFRQTTIFVPDYLLEQPAVAKSVSKEKASPDSEERRQHERIQAYMQREQPYLDSDLTLYKLAEQVQLPPHQLSQIINRQSGQNFFDFVNQYRVEAVKQKIEAGEAYQQTLLALALDSGFNSKAAFNRAFKKFTGITPSVYRKQLR